MAQLRSDQSISTEYLSSAQLFRASGALIGSAIGDALGAPFEFGGPREYSRMFPLPVLGGTGEMVGGGAFNWQPGEFTDDNQMALLLALSLIDNDGFNPDAVWDLFKSWSKKAPDVGNTTRAALSCADWRGASRTAHDRTNGRSGSNGSVMRVAPVGVAGVPLGAAATVNLAIAQSELTHWDPIAGVGAALVADTSRRLIIGDTFVTALTSSMEFLRAHCPQFEAELERYEQALHPDVDYGDDDSFLSNGGALVATAQAMWAVRTTQNFHDAMVRAIDLGGDTDTVAAIAGGIAGARYGLQSLPIRWVTYVHGKLPLPDGTVRMVDQQDIVNISRLLLGLGKAYVTPSEPPASPVKVHSAGVWAANLEGAASAPTDCAVVSMCITEDRFKKHPYRRNLALRDENGDANPNLENMVRDGVDAIDAFLDAGQEVVVHCHGGRSRTGLLLKAWYMRRERQTHAAADKWLQSQWPLYATYNQSFMDFLTLDWEFECGLSADTFLHNNTTEDPQ
jgi:ADP-ribosyl-[dinitrogen reductase] hydrolase